MKTHIKLLLALVLGIVLGTILHQVNDNSILIWINENILGIVSQVFLKLIFMIVVPMVFCALILGVYELASTDNLKRVARKTIFFTIVASTFSVLIGVGIVNIFKPGVSANLAQLFSQADQTQVMKIQESVSQTKSIKNTLLDMLPSNPVSAAANAMNGEMLALMVFTLIFGIAYASYHKQNPEKKPVLIPILENIYATTMIIVEYALKLAPIAVFSIIFNTSFKLGPYFLSSVFFYVFCVVLGLLIQQFVVYSILLKVFTKISPLDFFRKCKDVYLYAFSTASSNATLPEALETAEHKLKLSPRVSRFVLTVGATANQNGTALFEGVTVLFLAQVYGVDLSISSQFLVIITCILAGIGTAGVPGGSLPVIMILLGSIGVPPQAIGIILGVDRFLDMCRTTLNVSGDLVIAALVDE